MFSKILILCVLVSFSQCGIIQLPQAHAPSEDEGKDYFHYPQYKFGYGVKDPLTGDNKSQYEERDGDAVKGVYSVADPDGTLRTVHYTADDHTGFKAQVQKSGKAMHPQIYGKETVAVFSAEPLVHH